MQTLTPGASVAVASDSTAIMNSPILGPAGPLSHAEHAGEPLCRHSPSTSASSSQRVSSASRSDSITAASALSTPRPA